MSSKWTEEELKASVEAYVRMHDNEAQGIPFIKKQIYVDLSNKFGRTEKSYEYRMQNISHVYSLMGRRWVSGLKPAKNIGANTAATIERLISEVEKQDLPKVAEFESRVTFYQRKDDLDEPGGISHPKKNYTSITNFQRDPRVKAWVLKNANGLCECCDTKAPFVTTEGQPFLEVHHLKRLADGGSDTLTNTVALCPNCHREMHYGIKKASLIDSMYNKIQRLKRE